MKLVYFTDGQALQDRKVREQVLRIPEVLVAIRNVKFDCADPVMSFLYLEGDFEIWVEAVQKGLFRRLKKTGFKPSGIIKRKRFQSSEHLQNTLFSVLQSRATVELHVIGPSFDDLHKHIRTVQRKYGLLCDVIFHETIARDAKLTWFWTELRGQSLPQIPLEELAALLH